MSKYKRSLKEWEKHFCKKLSEVDQSGMDYMGGYTNAEDNLSPLLESKDALLRECRLFLVSMMGVKEPSAEEHGELLNKLKGI